ncbi:translation elongation factor 4 [Dellaglioa algida]|uniref:translation elongation factor 4 n=1 Tax=Dellaglioa algida TaxID=105612 RepID=UPI0024C48EAF|nr:translation elongation factor 4 [Dellaglioa algida]MDK1727984.1 translation elongation factor 4 [Dellaglioa algida]MDK1735619.1 translation elongation factor 4 [Dellaglioa algida]MDK1737315.1 translation elongation factor 4 [Dellaglioa algida]
MKQSQIRNFSIIAHIDHGKSTLADRIMEETQTVSEREMSSQLLDSMAVEQEHGITVKSRTVRSYYTANDGETFEYNFIDTPGHVDFSYEVSKSLAASDGAILLVDATQGVQAQTVANYRLAKENNLKIIPVINKIDHPNADVEETKIQLMELADVDEDEMLLISAKTGIGVDLVLEAIKDRIPEPVGDIEAPLKALVFDSHFDAFKGIVAYIRVFDGEFKANNLLRFMQQTTDFQVVEAGIFKPDMVAVDSLHAGDVGYVITGLKDPQLVKIGDTLTSQNHPTPEALPGYKESESMVFAGFYPKDNNYKELKSAIQKLALNDSSFHYKEEKSDALGLGFRCGFLGMLHLSIIRERLEKEYQLGVLTTTPNVTYHVILKNGKEVIVDNPVQFPDFSEIDHVEEPFLDVHMTVPDEQVGDIMKLAEKRKGIFQDMAYNSGQTELNYALPSSEIAYDFFNQLKSLSHGYATMETQFKGYQTADVVKMDVLVNYATVDALGFVVHRQDAVEIGQKLVEQLKYAIPRKLFPMPVQAVVENKAIARANVPPLRKSATTGSDKKNAAKQDMLRRQSANKRLGSKAEMDLPQEVFNAILEVNNDN